HRPAGKRVVALLEIERQALVHLDAAGGERTGFYREKADLHRPRLRAQDRGRRQQRARPEHAPEHGSALETHALSSLVGSARRMVSPPLRRRYSVAPILVIPIKSVAGKAREVAAASDSQVARFDLLVGSQLLRTGGIDHLTLADDVHVIDQLECQRGILLDQQDGQSFALEPGDRLPDAL